VPFGGYVAAYVGWPAFMEFTAIATGKHTPPNLVERASEFLFVIDRNVRHIHYTNAVDKFAVRTLLMLIVIFVRRWYNRISHLKHLLCFTWLEKPMNYSSSAFRILPHLNPNVQF
jgi:hypothetical protein